MNEPTQVKSISTMTHDELMEAARTCLSGAVKDEMEILALERQLRDFVRGDPVTAKELGLEVLMDQWVEDQKIVIRLFSVAATLFALWRSGDGQLNLTDGAAKLCSEIIGEARDRWGTQIDKVDLELVRDIAKGFGQ